MLPSLGFKFNFSFSPVDHSIVFFGLKSHLRYFYQEPSINYCLNVSFLQQRFTPCDPLRGAPELSLKELTEDSEFGLCSYDMMLPDSATIYGRMFLCAWDAGLDNVADDTVSLMLHATEVPLWFLFLL